MNKNSKVYHPPLNFNNSILNFVHFLKENNIPLPGDLFAQLEQCAELEGKELFDMNCKKQEYEKSKANYYSNREERYRLFQTAFQIVKATHGKEPGLSPIINSFKKKQKQRQKPQVDEVINNALANNNN